MPNEELAQALMVNDRLKQYLDPNIVERGNVLPFGITNGGEMEFAAPEAALELARALMLPGHVVQGGQYTEQDVTDMALTLGGSGGAVGAATAPVGSLGIFAGRMAKTADKAALKKAEELAAKGASRDDIWKETGWFQGPDKKWRFEIDDSQMTLNELAPGAQARGQGVAGDYSVIQHPELAKAFPQMQDDIDHLIAREGRGGSYQEGSYRGPYKDPDQLVAQGQTPEKMRSTTLHELQHGVQGREGFAEGGSPEQMLHDAIAAQHKVGKYGAIDPRGDYRRLAGEAESRNVQARQDFTPEQRQATPPWQTQDTPDRELIIRMLQQGGT